MKEIGEQLMEARTQMEISLDEVAADLKVEESQIEEIENGNLKAFDDIVNLKYFIKDYAKYLGLDYESIVDEYNEFLFDSTSKISLEDIREAKKMIENKEKKRKEKELRSPYTYIRKKRNIKKYICIILSVFIIVLVGFILVSKIKLPKKDVETVIR